MDLLGVDGMPIWVEAHQEQMEGAGLRLADLQSRLPHLQGPV